MPCDRDPFRCELRCEEKGKASEAELSTKELLDYVVSLMGLISVGALELNDSDKEGYSFPTNIVPPPGFFAAFRQNSLHIATNIDGAFSLLHDAFSRTRMGEIVASRGIRAVYVYDCLHDKLYPFSSDVIGRKIFMSFAMSPVDMIRRTLFMNFRRQPELSDTQTGELTSMLSGAISDSSCTELSLLTHLVSGRVQQLLECHGWSRGRSDDSFTSAFVRTPRRTSRPSSSRPSRLRLIQGGVR